VIDVQIFHQVPHSRYVALGVVDGLARALRTLGSVPPPQGEIECQIVRQTAPVARTFDPPRILWTFRNATGFLITDGTYVTRERRHDRRPLGDGAYDVRVRGDVYEDAEFALAWPVPPDTVRIPLNQPGKPDNVELRPGPSYPLPDVTLARLQLGPTILRGSLVTEAGDPIAGTAVEILNPPPFLAPPELPPLVAADWPFMEATSSARGDWILVLPPRRYINNTAEIPPGMNPPPITMPITVRIHYDGGPLDLLLPNVELGTDVAVRNTALRGQVVGPGGRPIAGAEITTSLGPQTSRSRDNGLWFLHYPLDQFPPGSITPVTVTALAPDGATANDSSTSVKSGATVVVPTFHFS